MNIIDIWTGSDELTVWMIIMPIFQMLFINHTANLQVEKWF